MQIRINVKPLSLRGGGPFLGPWPHFIAPQHIAIPGYDPEYVKYQSIAKKMSVRNKSLTDARMDVIKICNACVIDEILCNYQYILFLFLHIVYRGLTLCSIY